MPMTKHTRDPQTDEILDEVSLLEPVDTWIENMLNPDVEHPLMSWEVIKTPTVAEIRLILTQHGIEISTHGSIPLELQEKAMSLLPYASKDLRENIETPTTKELRQVLRENSFYVSPRGKLSPEMCSIAVRLLNGEDSDSSVVIDIRDSRHLRTRLDVLEKNHVITNQQERVLRCCENFARVLLAA